VIHGLSVVSCHSEFHCLKSLTLKPHRLGACVFQLLTSSHVPEMTRTSTHAPRNTPLMQFLDLSMVSTSYIRLTLYGLLIKAKLKLSPHAMQTNDKSEGTAPRIPKLCTKRRWAVIFTRWTVRPHKHSRYALGRKLHGLRARRDAMNNILYMHFVQSMSVVRTFDIRYI
jgi:hypothetical protein